MYSHSHCWKLLAILSIFGSTQVQSFRFRVDHDVKPITSNIKDPEIELRSSQILEKLLLPTDTKLEQELKSVVAEYLAETSKSNEVGRAGFGRGILTNVTRSKYHHWSHRDRYNQQVVTQQQQVVSVPAAPAPVQQAQPIAVQQAQPVAIQQAQPVVAQQTVPAPVPVEAARAPESVISPTQPPAPATAAQTVPVITGQPAAAVAPVQSVAPVAAAPVQSVPVQAAAAPVPVQSPAPVLAPVQQVVQVPVTVPTTTRRPRPTVSAAHALNQVDKILGNVATGNIVGIVDESLRIRAPEPVRNLVTNILKIVFCNPIDRFFGRCAQNQINAANTSQ